MNKTPEEGEAYIKTPNAELLVTDDATAKAAKELLAPLLDSESADQEDDSADARSDGGPARTVPPDKPLDHTNEQHLRWAYEEEGGVVGRAANYFDVSDERVRDMLAEHGIHDPEPVSGDPGYRDEDTLREEFEKCGRDIPATAHHFDVSDKTIRNWLHRFDIPDEPRYRDPEILEEAYVENDGVVTRTAEQFDASQTTIRKWLREFDILTDEEQDEDTENVDDESFDIDESEIKSVDIDELGYEYTPGTVAAQIARGESFYDIGNRLEVSRAEAHRICERLSIAERIATGQGVDESEVRERIEIAQKQVVVDGGRRKGDTQRVSLRMTKARIDELEGLVADGMFSSRSDAIRSMIRRSIDEAKADGPIRVVVKDLETDEDGRRPSVPREKE